MARNSSAGDGDGVTGREGRAGVCVLGAVDRWVLTWAKISSICARPALSIEDSDTVN